MVKTLRVVIGVLLLGGASASAQTAEGAARMGELDRSAATPRAGSTVNRHLGFFIRPDLGFGYMAVEEPTPFGKMKLSGTATMFGLHVGGALQENLILGGHLFSSVISDPKVSVGSSSVSSSDTSVSLVGIGPELTYYFMPVNAYVSATVALTRVALETGGDDASSEVGVGTRLALGKEWWVSDHWGLGLVGHFSYSSNRDQGTNAPTLDSWALGLAFSATYN